MKTIENQGFLATPNAIGRSEAVKTPACFQNASKVNGFEHISYGTALIKIIGLASLFYTITVSSLLAQTNKNNPVFSNLKLSDEIVHQLYEFETNKSLDHVKVAIAIDHLKNAIDNLKNDQFSMDRKQQATLWFEILVAIDRHLSPNFNETNANFSANLVPPPDGGVQYPSGIDPSVIKDPIARAKYEAMLKTNRENAESYGFQLYLHRINDQTILDAKKYVRSSYAPSGADKKELDEIINECKMPPHLKEKINEFLL
jgi:hypothetical protein